VIAVAQHPDSGRRRLAIGAYIATNVDEINAEIRVFVVYRSPMNAASKAAAYLTLRRVEFNICVASNSIWVPTAR
jgi:hypothetical protein